MGRPALTQRIAQVRNFTTGTLDSTSNRTRHRRRGACSHALWPTRRASLAKPKNPHAALVYLLPEPLSLGIPVKARCGLGETAGRFSQIRQAITRAVDAIPDPKA